MVEKIFFLYSTWNYMMKLIHIKKADIYNKNMSRQMALFLQTSHSWLSDFSVVTFKSNVMNWVLAPVAVCAVIYHAVICLTQVRSQTLQVYRTVENRSPNSLSDRLKSRTGFSPCLKMRRWRIFGNKHNGGCCLTPPRQFSSESEMKFTVPCVIPPMTQIAV